MLGPWAALRKARYAAPHYVERLLPGPGPGAAARRCRKLNSLGLAATLGYFQAADAAPEDIVAANLAAARLLAGRSGDVYLSVKAPPLGFDPARLRAIADSAATAGMNLLFDAHAAKDADRTLKAVSDLLGPFPGTGFALPARWLRSRADAAAFRDGSARIRLVKGEWGDPEWRGMDAEASYLALAARLAGRAAPVAVATHDPGLAERALTLLLASGTPCELEQLRGLPSQRTMAVARRLGVPVRVYVPFGPGWWPYALDKALARPYLLSWMIRDRWASTRRLEPDPRSAFAGIEGEA
ncbi:MAG TPA: proline dehydrogenase family protein [Allosphingosinicella sp.]|jgi:proline dehydrogenase|nr:proline dehydrogenase family protein [Allosphingosinicella sp.]